MSVEFLSVVLNHSRAQGVDRLVLIGIANHEGDGGSFPAVQTLADYANVSERSVQRSLGKLQRLGELMVEVRAGGLRDTAYYKRTNLYRVMVRCPESCPGGPRHQRTKHLNGNEKQEQADLLSLPHPVTAVSPHPVTAVSPHPVTAVSPHPVTAVSPDPVTAVSPKPSLEPSLEPGESPNPRPTRGPGARCPAHSDMASPPPCRACGTSPRELVRREQAARRAEQQQQHRRPDWCGHCDERTRFTDEEQPRRCPDCHQRRTGEATGELRIVR